MMADTAQEQLRSLKQRLSQNPQSPIFVRLAAYYIQNGLAKEALRLCDDGLALFPFYSTAHLIKGKALEELGMMAEARHEFDVVHKLLPMNAMAAKLCASIALEPPQDFEASPVAEEIVEVEPEAPAAIERPPEPPAVEEPQVIAVEEPLPQETAATTEQGSGVEEAPAPEPVPEEPQIAEQAEPVPVSAGGFGETQTAEPQPEEPGASENLGPEMQPEPQQPLYDSGFSYAEQAPQVPAAEDLGFGTEQPATDQRQEASTPELSGTEAVPTAEEHASPTAEPAAGWYETISHVQQPAEKTPDTPREAPQPEEENPFAVFGAEEPPTIVEGEPYEDFTARVRKDLIGTEDTLTLEEYLGQSAPPQAPSAAEDNIGELAEKLMTSPRMTPPVINFSEKAPHAAGETDPGGATGFVTPTLAEIYVKQGWLEDAIMAYRALATNIPAESAKFQQRIAEIEEMRKKQ